jgi:tetratricopeptide (TPR) repeat protein
MRETAFVALLLAATVVVNDARAQDLALSRLAARCDGTIGWITDGYASPDAGRPVPIPNDGVDRSALLDVALKRAAEEKKLVLWYVTRLHGPQVYRSPILDDYLRIAAFTDPRLCALIDGRFVPLRMAATKEIGERTGVAALEWVEPAFAILSPEGKVLRKFDRIRSFGVERFRALLVGTLRRHADLAPSPAALTKALSEAGDDPAKLAAVAGTASVVAADDVLESAAAKLEATGNAVEAALFRLTASVDLETAEERSKTFRAAVEAKGNPEPFAAFTRVAEAKIALYRGHYAEAAKEFAALAKSDMPAVVRPDALYRLAATQILKGDSTGAETTFRKLCDQFPDHPRAWQAATNLLVGKDTTPIGPAFHHFEEHALPTRDEVAWLETAESTTRARSTKEAREVVARAATWLLDRQDARGLWKDSRYAYWSSPRILPNAWTAISAIAATALLEWRDVAPDRVDAALARAERALFDPRNMARGQNEEIYADGYRLLYLSKRLAAPGLAEKDATRARERAAEIVKEIERQQNDRGFFGHEYANPFTTAATLVFVDAARKAEIPTGASIFESGAKALSATRSPEGAFAYGAGRAPDDGEEAHKNSAVRSPVCEYALRLSGSGGEAALAASFDRMQTYLPRLEKVRVCDFHSDGELAGFFFWHGVHLASEATKGLPEDARAARRAALLELVLRSGEADGAFVDSHEMGKSYGTGMALLTLKNVLPPEGP